jgi:release factor glutamine methyltransferase
MSASSQEIFQTIKQSVLARYDANEAASIAFLFIEQYFGLTQSQVLANRQIGQIDFEEFERMLKRLETGEPVQYVIGKSWFYGREFKVNTSTLIPRPETEELVNMIVKREGIDFAGKILDVGTGTGCIAISLGLELPEAKVFAIDVSEATLQVAKLNNEILGASVQFDLLDFLDKTPKFDPYQILVSNPPYIPQNNLEQLQDNVTKHEPHLALFVDEPLIFYQRIAELAPDIMTAGGRIYVEIHDDFGEEVKQCFLQNALTKVEVHQDINGKDRMVSAIWRP